jgi:hypothetical protein
LNKQVKKIKSFAKPVENFIFHNHCTVQKYIVVLPREVRTTKSNNQGTAFGF